MTCKQCGAELEFVEDVGLYWDESVKDWHGEIYCLRNQLATKEKEAQAQNKIIEALNIPGWESYSHPDQAFILGLRFQTAQFKQDNKDLKNQVTNLQEHPPTFITTELDVSPKARKLIKELYKTRQERNKLKEATTAICVWKSAYCKYDYEWSPSCGGDCIIMDETPEEWGYKYCPYCGKKIETQIEEKKNESPN